MNHISLSCYAAELGWTLYRLFMWYRNCDLVSLVAPLLAVVVGPNQSSQLHCPRLTRSCITPLHMQTLRVADLGRS